MCACVCGYGVCRGQNSAVQQQQQVQLQQQLTILASAPFGDSPLFRTGLAVSVDGLVALVILIGMVTFI